MEATPTKKPSKHVAVRLDVEELKRLEAMRAGMALPWREATQSDALRAAILKGLEVLERELQRSPAG